MLKELDPSLNGGQEVSLIKCPICPVTFGENEGSKRRWHYIKDHTPSDFGLTPMIHE